MISVLDAITVEEQNTILNTVLNKNFPWYYNDKNTVMAANVHEHVHVHENFENTPFLSHTLVARYDENNLYLQKPGVVNSDYWNLFKPIVERIAKPKKHIYRSSLNFTWGNNRKQYTIPHVDHYFDHKNLIIYLNSFTNGYTYILNDDLRVIGMAIPEPRKAIIFDGLLHCVGFCNSDEIRLVLVTTYI